MHNFAQKMLTKRVKVVTWSWFCNLIGSWWCNQH